MSTSMKKADIKKVASFLLAFLLILLIGFLPAVTDSMSRNAWLYLGIFCGLLSLFFTKAVPDWTAALGALCLIVIFRVGSLNDTFSSFGQSTVWLLIGIFGLSVGLTNSGLIRRVTFKILNKFPHNYKGEVLAIFIAGLAMSPLIPCSAAKTSLFLPISTEISESVGLKPHSKEALGIFTAALLPAYFFGVAFLTGSAFVPLMLGFIKEEFSWIGWLAGTWPWLVVAVILTYVFCTVVCKPKGEQHELPADFFSKKLQEMGPMTRPEKQCGIILIVALALWLTQSLHGIDAGIVSLLVVVAMVACGLMDTKEFAAKVPWGLIVFVGSLISLSGFMSTTKAGSWVASLVGPIITPIVSSPWIFVPVLCIFTFLLRFVIVSQLVSLAVVMAIFTPFLATYGISPFVVVWISMISGITWNVAYQNPVVVGMVALGGGKYVTFDDSRKISLLYMVICIIGMTVSIPVWQTLGLC